MWSLLEVILFLTKWIEAIQSTNINFFGSTTVQFNGLHFIACLLVCKNYRLKNKYERYWLESLMSVFLLRFGGTLLMAILLGQPPSWMLVHSTPFSLYLAWWLTFCCPNDFYWNYVSNSWWVFEIVSVFDAISQGHAITSWGMDKALFNNFHNNSSAIGSALVLNVICGVVSSNGGAILADTMGLFEEKSYTLTRPPAFLSSGKDGDAARVKMTKCFLLACVYFGIIRAPPIEGLAWIPDDLVEKKLFGHMIVCMLQIVDLLQTKIFGSSVNVFGFLGSFWLTAIMIPRTVQAKQSITKHETTSQETPAREETTAVTRKSRRGRSKSGKKTD